MNLLNRIFVVGLIIGLSVIFFTPRITRVAAQGPQPGGLDPAVLPLGQVETLTMPPVDREKLLREDEQAAPDQPPRFAQPIPVRITPQTNGTWESLGQGRQMWRLRVVSPQAVSLNFGFTRYVMPPGGQLFLYTPDYQTVVGPFTDEDNEVHGQLWTPLLPGADVIIEVTLPEAAVAQLELALTSVNHGYVEFGRAPEKSGSCNLDVVCTASNGFPQVDPWRAEIRSVGVYSLGGARFCTGALVNNTALDQKPYFLTADHCNLNSGNAASVVVFWNYQNSTCRVPGSSASGAAGNGSLSQFQTGSFFRAEYGPSDMTLLELDDPISQAFNVHFAGWDRTGSNATSAVAIHHPSTDEKRISFENDPTSITAYFGTTVPGDGTHVRVTDWDLGTTEPGSSGSPLFDQNHRIIGQLHGGTAACGNDSSDYYGRFFVSWTGGGAAATRLSNWLDPGNTGTVVLNGIDNRPDFTLTATPSNQAICAPANAVYNVAIGSIVGYNAPVSLSVSGRPAGTTANFSANPVTPPGNPVLTIGNTGAAAAGSYNLNVVGVAPTSTHTTTVTLDLFTSIPGTAGLVVPANGAVNMPIGPTFSWTAASQTLNYSLQVVSDPGFSTLVYSATITGTSHTAATSLAGNTTYYWRVRSINGCGPGAFSTTFSFKTTAVYCNTPNVTIPDNNSTGVTNTLTITHTDAPLTKLNVSIKATHAFVGDLIFTLRHVDSGTNVTLIDQPGFPSSPFGCERANIDAVLDDEASAPVENQCANSVPTIAGTFKPHNPLSAFAGQNLAGVWRLTAADNIAGGTGTLLEWCLIGAEENFAPEGHYVYLPVIVK